MGTLSFSAALPEVVIEDRLLAHLHLVISRKFRQRESFFLQIPARQGTSPCLVWLDHKMAIRITYVDDETPPINPEWVSTLLELSYRPTGLVVAPEPAR